MLALANVFVIVPGIVGWGFRGHWESAYVSTRFLTPSTVTFVHSALEVSDPDSLTREYVRASTWADSAGENPMFSDEYHFVHSEYRKCLPYDESRDCGFGNSGKCLVTGIVKFVSELGHEKSTEAVKMIIHLVADLHQPLHSGFARDHGGLDIKLGGGLEAKSLHDVWDNVLLDEVKDVLGDGETAATAAVMFKKEKKIFEDLWETHERISPVTTLQSVQNIVHTWVARIVSEMSSTYTCPIAYSRGNVFGDWIELGDILSAEYLQTRENIAKDLLVLSGVRLAVLLNRVVKFLRKQESALKHAISNNHPTSAPVSPNRFAVLTVEDFDFDPNTLTDYPNPDSRDSESNPHPPRKEQVPEIVHGVDLGSLRMFRRDKGWVSVSTREKLLNRDTGLFWSHFNVEFPRNSDKVGKNVRMSFDLDVFSSVSLRDADFLITVISRLRGIKLGGDKNCRRPELPCGRSVPCLEPVKGTGGKLPTHAMTNVELSNDDRKPPSEVIRVLPNGLLLSTSPLGTQFEFDPDTKKFDLTDTYRTELQQSLAIVQSCADTKFSHIPDPAQRMLAWRKLKLAKSCNTIVQINTAQAIFLTTFQSIQNSNRKPRNPLRVFLNDISVSRNKVLPMLIDTNLYDGHITAEVLDMLNECVAINVATNLFECADKSKRKTFPPRELICAEVDEVIYNVKNPDKDPPSVHIHQIMIYQHELMPPVLAIEWDLFHI